MRKEKKEESTILRDPPPCPSVSPLPLPHLPLSPSSPSVGPLPLPSSQRRLMAALLPPMHSLLRPLRRHPHHKALAAAPRSILCLIANSSLSEHHHPYRHKLITIQKLSLPTPRCPSIITVITNPTHCTTVITINTNSIHYKTISTIITNIIVKLFPLPTSALEIRAKTFFF